MNTRSSNHLEEYLSKYNNRLNDIKMNFVEKKTTANESSVGCSSSCVYKLRNRDIKLNENSCLNDEKTLQTDK